MKIKYSIGPSRIGRLLVAESEKGLCAVRVRGTDAALEQSLREQFADAVIVRDERAVAPLRKMVLASIAGKSAPRNVELDIEGTEFQRAVWRELRRIPAGATRSYADVALAIGKPKATRAVANACGANPIPVLIPCHRVIGSDGGIGGYTGGVEIKRALLAAEGIDLG
jgi:AraC family transcriptional regulator, regulatory protein of adaptative response / methylated-DNA-[protein]-cysteine methyltransferase